MLTVLLVSFATSAFAAKCKVSTGSEEIEIMIYNVKTLPEAGLKITDLEPTRLGNKNFSIQIIEGSKLQFVVQEGRRGVESITNRTQIVAENKLHIGNGGGSIKCQ